jgi:hypothetical protein
MIKKYPFVIAFLIMLAAIVGCTQKKVFITSLPPNTPKGAQIFVAGNFNNWNPGDPNYLLKYDAETQKYWAALPAGFGKIEYKFTRGDWTTSETDSCGAEFGNRTFTTTDTEDWISNSIASWHDLEPANCSKLVLVIDSIPENSPKNAPIFLIGNINDWTCAKPSSKFTKANNGKYFLTVFRQRNNLEYKINRGFNETVEANEFGKEVDIRTLDFGKKDTIHINIKAWLDLPLKNHTKHTFIINNVPINTPKNASIFLVGDFNGWNPYDKNLQFTKLSNGKYALTIAFKDKKTHQFKITRGGWDFEEADAAYNPLNNRKVDLTKNDTSFITIERWFDKNPRYIERIEKRASALEILLPGITELIKPEPKEIPEKISISDKSRKITFIINVPNYTSNYDKIFLTGDFNHWNASDDRYIFRKIAPFRYIYTLRLKDNNAHEFKIVNGDWDNEEANYRAERMNNRRFECCNTSDTIYLKIINWYNYNAKRKLVFIIDKLPTDSKEPIYLAGDFNNWNAKDEQFRFLNSNENKRILYLHNFDKNYNYFKITKGSWDTEFIDKKGNNYPKLPFNTSIKNDTIRFDIYNWKN